MNRISKDPETRRKEILASANALFYEKGYQETSVHDITDRTNISKGTFYYYFESKRHVLEAIADSIVDDAVDSGNALADNDEYSVLQKLEALLGSDGQSNQEASRINDELHSPENTELHDKINTRMITRFAPVLAKIVDQGISQKLFSVTNSLETCQFLLAGGQLLFDIGMFDWSDSEWHERRVAMQSIIERSLGASTGSFKFIAGKKAAGNA